MRALAEGNERIRLDEIIKALFTTSNGVLLRLLNGIFDENFMEDEVEISMENKEFPFWTSLDQKVDPLEFLYRLKAVALEFNKLTDTQKMILKHWIRNTVDETIAEDAVKILDSDKEGVEKMVANNAFMIGEIKLQFFGLWKKMTPVQYRNHLLIK